MRHNVGYEHANQDHHQIICGVGATAGTDRACRASSCLAIDGDQMTIADDEWAWEGHVQSRVATHLTTNGWSIIRVADTAQREPGPDIKAERDGQTLLVEVKGWPSTTYAHGPLAGQPKPTPAPGTQARVWLAEALLTTLVRRGAEPGARPAMGLPDKPRYRTLLRQAGQALERLDITVYLVTAEGAVHTWEPEN